MNATITCPNCNQLFELTEAIERPILEKERKKIAADESRKAEEAVSARLRDLATQLDEQKRRLEEAERAELRFLKEKREFANEKSAFKLEKVRQIEAERQKIRDEATNAAAEASAISLQELQLKLAAKEKRLAEAKQIEMTLRKERAEFEEVKQGFELELARRSDLVKDEVKKEKDEEHRLKEAEKNKQLDDMRRQIDDLRRKADQASQNRKERRHGVMDGWEN